MREGKGEPVVPRVFLLRIAARLRQSRLGSLLRGG